MKASTSPRDRDIRALNTALWRMSEQYRRGFSRVIDPGRYGVLNIVAAHELIRPTEIADELDMVPSSVSRHLQALAADGLVAVDGNPDDRRSSLVTVTDAGRAALERFEEGGVAASRTVMADWTRGEIVELTSAVLRLIESWERHGSAARRPGQLGGERAGGSAGTRI
jgi:DNA-binding MarR family transcriptional regulator